MIAYYKAAGPDSSAVIVVRETGEGSDSAYGVNPQQAMQLAAIHAAHRDDLIAAAQAYVIGTMVQP